MWLVVAYSVHTSFITVAFLEVVTLLSQYMYYACGGLGPNAFICFF